MLTSREELKPTAPRQSSIEQRRQSVKKIFRQASDIHWTIRIAPFDSAVEWIVNGRLGRGEHSLTPEVRPGGCEGRRNVSLMVATKLAE